MSARDDLASFRVLEQHETLAACLKEEFEDDWAGGRKVLVLAADYCSATERTSLRGSSGDWSCKKRAGALGIATPLPGGGAAMIDVVDLRGQAHTAPLKAQFFATGIREAERLLEAHFGGLPSVVSIWLGGGLHLRASAFLYSVVLGNPTLLKYDAARAQFSALYSLPCAILTPLRRKGQLRNKWAGVREASRLRLQPLFLASRLPRIPSAGSRARGAGAPPKRAGSARHPSAPQ